MVLQTVQASRATNPCLGLLEVRSCILSVITELKLSELRSKFDLNRCYGRLSAGMHGAVVPAGNKSWTWQGQTISTEYNPVVCFKPLCLNSVWCCDIYANQLGGRL